MTTATPRISGSPSDGATRRLVPTLKTVDPWAGAWGDSWHTSWGTPGITLGLQVQRTARVGSAPAQSVTKRVSL